MSTALQMRLLRRRKGLKPVRIAKGHPFKGGLQANVVLPTDMFNSLSKMASKAKCSFSEQLRTVVEWGLESVEKVSRLP